MEQAAPSSAFPQPSPLDSLPLSEPEIPPPRLDSPPSATIVVWRPVTPTPEEPPLAELVEPLMTTPPGSPQARARIEASEIAPKISSLEST